MRRMKLGLCFLFTLMTVLVFSQFKIIYEYKNSNDSIFGKIRNYMVLETSKSNTQSVFYNELKMSNDSLLNRMNFNDLQKVEIKKYNPILTYSIFKNANSNNKIYRNNLFGIHIKLIDNEKIIWKIVSDKMIISNYECQKAICTINGTSWEAWFTDEIPIPDGPYKFDGLPGLIIKIVDKEHKHQFELVELRKNATPINRIIPKSEKTINKSKLIELINGSSDVNKNIKTMNVGVDGIYFNMKDGNLLQMDKNNPNIMKDLEKYYKSTNYIEYLY